MGQLVFQAALGGQTNLVGPNTASTINLNVPAVNGTIVTTGDTASVTSAMISGPVTVAKGGTGLTSTPSNGQLDIGNGTDFTRATLTAGTGITVTNGSGSITIASSGASNGPIGTDLSYVDYSLTTSSAINSAVSASIYMQSISLDGTSELMIIFSTSSAHAVVWNSSTNTFGTPILVRTASFTAAQNNIAIAKISTTQALVCSLVVGGTALETVVLTVSGSTITVGTALATTLAAASTLIAPNARLVTVGTSYVLNYFTTSGSLPKFRAITVSASTPSIGSELAYAGGTLATMHHSYAHSASILLHFSMTSATTVFVLPITVSGTTLTAGTAATVSTTGTTIVTGALSNSRYALGYLNTTGRGAVVSVAGTVASISTAATTMAVTSWSPMMQVFGNQAFILGGTTASENINLITDTAGVATLGTDLAVPIAGAFVNYLSTSKVFFASYTAGQSTHYQYGISSGSAALEKTFPNVTSTTVATVGVAGLSLYTTPLSGLPQSGSGTTSISLRTSAGKMVTAGTQLPFVASIDGTYVAKIQQSANPFNSGSFNDAISDAVCWGFPTAQAASTTTVQLRKVTLA